MNFYSQWEEVPDNIVYENGFKIQWEDFIRHVAADTPWHHDLIEGVKGVQLAELGMKSWAERRWLDVPEIKIIGDTTWRRLALANDRPEARALYDRRADRVPAQGSDRRISTASPMRPRMWSPIRSPTTIRGSTPRSTGTRPSQFRHYLWDLGLGVAEAMDTAQRGGGLDWPKAQAN